MAVARQNLTVPATPEEVAEVEAAAKKAGITRTKFMKQAVMKATAAILKTAKDTESQA